MALCKRVEGIMIRYFISTPRIYSSGRLGLGPELGYATYFHKNFQIHRKFSSRIVNLEKRKASDKLLSNFRSSRQITELKGYSTTPRTNSKAESGFSSGLKKGTKSTLYYITALGVATLGLSYAAVPLYRIFCQAYSYGGTTQQGHDVEKVETMQKVEDRIIKIRFNADTAAAMTWNFRPQQIEIKVLPGETALAFYTARNPTDKPVIGVSTYNVIPFDAGQYFNKIQCFCFEEQLLNPHEEVHMPVFFYIDPDFAADPKMENVDQITLSYTFFEAREGFPIPIPNFIKN